MTWWVVLGACWTWLASGPEGLKNAFALGGLTVLAVATAKLLDFISTGKTRRKRSAEMKIWKPRQVELSAFARRRRAQK
jgi:hypothetical protein